MNFKAAITQVALAVAFSSAAQAAVIYDNGAPNQSNGNEATQWIQSEDFTFTAATRITDVHFWNVDSGRLADGTISWFIYADAAGVPGAVISSGNTGAVTRTATGAVLGFGTEFLNEFISRRPFLQPAPTISGSTTAPLPLTHVQSFIGRPPQRRSARSVWKTIRPLVLGVEQQRSGTCVYVYR